jgi:2,5-furandicarboxylate decarboxylase 1
MVASGFRTLPLDPSLGDETTGAKIGYDLTMPSAGASGAKGLEAEIPKPPCLDGARFASVEAALQDGPKFFAELMAAVASHDGREIVPVLEALHAEGRLRRDATDGRYSVVK